MLKLKDKFKLKVIRYSDINNSYYSYYGEDDSNSIISSHRWIKRSNACRYWNDSKYYYLIFDCKCGATLKEHHGGKIHQNFMHIFNNEYPTCPYSEADHIVCDIIC